MFDGRVLRILWKVAVLGVHKLSTWSLVVVVVRNSSSMRKTVDVRHD
jgi:hypothetical protein